MKRHTVFTRLLVLASLWLAGCGGGNAGGANSPETRADMQASRPNIVVILADDLGWGDVGINGADFIKTPNIDRVGNEGVTLSSFYAGANACTPSRAAMLTGRYAVRSGMQHIIFPYSQEGLPTSEITVPEILRQAGYATGMVGKWHLGHQPEHWPTEHGFDKFYGVAYSNDMQPFDLYHHKTVVESPVDQTQLTNKYAQAAEDFIKSSAETGQPFFLYFAETFPHIPLFVPSESTAQSEAGLYGDVVEHLDKGIGRILGALERAGVADNTLVIITSDNGPWFEGSSGTQHRGRKGGTHEGGYLVPFLARWPAMIKPGTRSDAMTMNIDLLPTLVRLAGADIPQDRVIDGRDISAVLAGAPDSPHDVLFFFDGNEVAAVRDSRYQLLLKQHYNKWYVPFEELGGPLLFDLEKDPQSRFSYARDNPDVVARLMDNVTAMRGETQDLHKPREPAPQGDDAHAHHRPNPLGAKAE